MRDGEAWVLHAASSRLRARLCPCAQFLEEVTHQIERYDKGLKQAGVLPYIPRFALLAARMEQLVRGGARDAVDAAYERLVGTMFAVLHRIAAADPKHAPVLLLENYAAFQNSTFDLANSVPTLAAHYQQASDAYEQACADYVHAAIAYVRPPPAPPPLSAACCMLRPDAGGPCSHCVAADIVRVGGAAIWEAVPVR